MARSADGATSGGRQEWRQLVSGGGLLAAVLAILVFGAIRESPPGSPPATVPVASIPTTRAVLPEQAEPLPRAAEVLEPLERRTLEDPERLARAAGSFTLQINVACRKDAADRLLERAGGSDRLYVLPVSVKGQDCFRFCWGAYASAEEAARGRDLPQALRAGLDAPRPKRISEMLP